MSSHKSFETVFETLQQYYNIINRMTSVTYHMSTINKSLKFKLGSFNYDQQLRILTIYYKILSTYAGSIYLSHWKDYSVYYISKGDELIKKLKNKLKNDIEIELLREISYFIKVNKDIFSDHGISSLYNDFDVDVYERIEDEDCEEYKYEDDDEDDEDEPRRYHTFDSDTDFSDND
jgi:hypothetical protein